MVKVNPTRASTIPWTRRYRLLYSPLPFGHVLLVALILAWKCVLLAALRGVSRESVIGSRSDDLPGSSGSLLLRRPFPVVLLFDPLSRLSRFPFFVKSGLGDLA